METLGKILPDQNSLVTIEFDSSLITNTMNYSRKAFRKEKNASSKVEVVKKHGKSSNQKNENSKNCNSSNTNKKSSCNNGLSNIDSYPKGKH